MFRRGLASCLSSLLAFSPLPAAIARAEGAPAPLEARIKIALKDYQKSYLAATLGTTPDLEKLKKEYEALKAPLPGPDLKKSWQDLEKSAADFEGFKSRFLTFAPRQLNTKLGELGLGLGIARDDLLKAFPAVLPRYQALQEKLTISGVYWDAGKGSFANPDGPVNPDEFLPPQLTPDIDARIDKLNFKLIEIHNLAKSKKFDQAAAQFAEIVDGLGGHGGSGGILEQGLGSLGMETTLSLVNETYKLLSGDDAKSAVSAENQAKLASSIERVDTQLTKIAQKKITVPIPGSGNREDVEKALNDEPVSLATKFKLATFAAMSELPVFSGWAEEKFFHLQTAEIMRGNKDVKSFAFKRWDPTWDPNDPEDKKRPRYRLGVEIVYKDKTIYESRDHQLLIVTDAKTGSVIVDDKMAGRHKKTVRGIVFYDWRTDKNTGGQVGVFRGTRFETGKDEAVFMSGDGNSLYVAAGTTPDGQPRNMLRWYADKQRGYYLPDGKGTIVRNWGAEGGIHNDLFLDKKVIAEWAQTGKLDLSFLDRLPEDVKKQIDHETSGNMGDYTKFLRELPRFGGLFEAAVKGESMEYESGKQHIHKRSYVSSLYFRDGVLNVVMGEEGTTTGPDRKTGKVAAKEWKDDSDVSLRVVMDQEGGKKVMKAFLFTGDSNFMYKLDEDFTKWDEYRTDSEVFVEQGGKIEFVLSRKNEKRGGKWVTTENHPIATKEWTAWDTVKAGGKGVLSGLGTAVEVVLSPISTALDGILGSIHLAAGGMLSLFEGSREFATFEKIAAMYTLRQAKFNEWFGSGTHAATKSVVKNGKTVAVADHGPVLESYGQAMNLVGDKDMRVMVENFLDGEIRKAAKIRWGELWRFHKDDPITHLDRAYMAAGTFGYANLAAQYFAQGREAWENGDYVGGVVGYGLGGTYIGVRAFAETAGLGIATTPLKVGVAALKTGKTYEEVATLLKTVEQAKRVGSAAKLTEAQQVILENVGNTMKAISYGEMAFYLTPAGGQFIVDGVGMVNAAGDGDTEGKWRHFNGMFSSVSAFAGIIGGVKIAGKVAQMQVRYDVQQGKNVLPEGFALDPVGRGKQATLGSAKTVPVTKTAVKVPIKPAPETGFKTGVENAPKTGVEISSKKSLAKTPPAVPTTGQSAMRPSGKITLKTNRGTEALDVTFDKKPGSMEATFMGKDSSGRSLVMKGEEYIGVSASKKPRAPGESTPMQREASIITQVSRLVEQAKSEGLLPQNVGVPEVIGLGVMDAALAKQVYGRAKPVEILILAKADGVNMQAWLGRGKVLDAAGYKGVKDLVRFLHREGIIHGDLNPGNIMIHELPNGRQQFTLVDFGASKRFSSNPRISEIPANRMSDYKSMDIEMLTELEGYFREAGKIRTGVPLQSPVAAKTAPVKPTAERLTVLREKVIGKKLPGADKAVLDMRKFTEYMLNKQHPKGGSKARYMEEALGYTQADAAQLIKVFQEQVKARNVEAIEFNGNQSGYLFVVPVEVPGIGPKAGRTLPIRTVWNINPGATAPTFVTAYPNR